MRAAIITAALSVLGLLLGIGETQTAEAAHNTFILPYDIGRNWRVCLGYEAPGTTHDDTFALDLTTAPSTDPCNATATENKRVRAPFTGTVQSVNSARGEVCLKSSDGIRMRLGHIDYTVSAGASVTRGQKIGTVAPANPPERRRGNRGIAHLHIENYVGSACPGDLDHDRPFDSAFGTNLSGYNLPNTGRLDLSRGQYYNTRLIRRPVTVCDNVNCPSGTPMFDLPSASNCNDTACSKNYPNLARDEPYGPGIRAGIRWGDRIHAVIVRRGCKAILWRDPDYEGPSLTLTSSDLDLRNNPLGSGHWGDNASSIKTTCK